MDLLGHLQYVTPHPYTRGPRLTWLTVLIIIIIVVVVLIYIFVIRGNNGAANEVKPGNGKRALEGLHDLGKRLPVVQDAAKSMALLARQQLHLPPAAQ